MIVMGYPGIGKSTISDSSLRIIDLESSCFHSDKFQSTHGWEQIYCDTAQYLSKQGYVVLVSCHKNVQKILKRLKSPDIFIIYPSKNLKEEWLNRLMDRFVKSGNMKDYRAYESARDYYYTHIEEIEQSWRDSQRICVNTVDYKLGNILTSLFNKEEEILNES